MPTGKKSSNNAAFVIPAPNYEMLEVKVRGIQGSPLVVHRISEKYKKEMEERGQNNTSKKGAPKPKRNPEEEYLASMYCIPGEKNSYGLPASGFKKAMCTAAKDIPGRDISGAGVLRQIFVMADVGRLVRIKSKEGPKMREDIVRIGRGQAKTPDLRYRAEFDDWEATLVIRYDADLYSWESIVHLLARTGITVGWGEMRPEKGYECGMFEIVGKPKVKRRAA